MTITSQQVRAARALLEWSRVTLAARSRITNQTVRNIETGKVRPRARTVQMIGRALEAAGVEFVEGEPCVKLKTKP
jgi:DNA-binding XRE family transcriptional regulator